MSQDEKNEQNSIEKPADDTNMSLEEFQEYMWMSMSDFDWAELKKFWDDLDYCPNPRRSGQRRYGGKRNQQSSARIVKSHSNGAQSSSTSDGQSDMNAFIRTLPKAELHAHLNGSVSEKTLKALIDEKKAKCPDYSPTFDPDVLSPKNLVNKSLDEIFQIFPLIHELTDNEAAIFRVCHDVIKEFAADNVKYLELRTSPKDNTQSDMTCESYLKSVIKAIRSASHKFDIVVKLLLSIDRSKGLESADNIARLAEEYARRTNIVVGLDLSGNPKSDGLQYLPLLKRAQQNGLKLSIHLAEVPGADDEIARYLTLPPDRIGHGTYLHDCRHSIVDEITRLNIPFEMCLTSNVVSGTVKSYKDHHWNIWCNKNPIIVCTDDKGIFGTNLSQEYALVADTFELSKNDVTQLALNGFKYGFCEDATKHRLLKRFFPDEWKGFCTNLIK